MSLKVLIAPLLVAAASLTACGQGTPDTPDAAKSPASASPTASAGAGASRRPGALRSLRPVAKITSACALLTAAELKTLLGGASSRTAITATPKISDGDHECIYGTKTAKPFALIVTTSSTRTFTPQKSINAIANAANVKTRRVPGIGSAAVFYITDGGIGLIAAGKKSYGQTRTVIFSAPKVVPGRKFAEVARLVISRI